MLGKVSLFSSPIQMLFLSRNTLIDTSTRMFDQIFGHVAQSSWNIKLTSILYVSNKKNVKYLC